VFADGTAAYFVPPWIYTVVDDRFIWEISQTQAMKHRVVVLEGVIRIHPLE
jgi:hypothetical protein